MKTDATKIFQFILALVVFGMVGGAMLCLLTNNAIPETNKTLLTYMLGNIMGIAATVGAFFFPSSVGSSKKDDTISGLVDAVQAQQKLPAIPVNEGTADDSRP